MFMSMVNACGHTTPNRIIKEGIHTPIYVHYMTEELIFESYQFVYKPRIRSPSSKDLPPDPLLFVFLNARRTRSQKQGIDN